MGRFIKSVLLVSLSALLLSACASGGDGEVRRAVGYKAIALTQVRKSELDFSNDKSLKPYADYLAKVHILDEEPSQKKLEGFLSYKDLRDLAKKMQDHTDLMNWLNQKDANKYITEEDFYIFFDFWCREMNTSGYVREFEDIVYGAANLQTANSKEADRTLSTIAYLYRSGKYYCRDLKFLRGLFDKKLHFVVADDEIIFVRGVIDKNVIYENVLLSLENTERLRIIIKDTTREFALKDPKSIEGLYDGSIADLVLEDSGIREIRVKVKKIRGEVLSIADDRIEIGGLGLVQIANNFATYAYDNRGSEAIHEIRLGEEVYDFYIEDGQLQAAIKATEFRRDSIRVLVKNSNFSQSHHYTVSLSSDSEMTVKIGSEERRIPAGEAFGVANSDENLDQRIFIEATDKRHPIRVDSITRDQGTPSYFGRLEIIKRNDVLYLINDVDVESYLKFVVPSEMPSNYNMEALKAQAVCARTYAYAHIEQTGELAEYGAQVDDSINYQVYNNYPRTEATDRAVDETAGEVLRYNGKLISALFYSTSSGVSADGTIWGSDKSHYPYFQVHTITRDKRSVNFENEEEISGFLHSKQEDAYEKDMPYYRWDVRLNSRNIADRIPEVGTISDIAIIKRGPGGIAESIRVDGSGGSIVISGQNEIRYRLGHEGLRFKMNDGQEFGNFRTLPSAFITMYREKKSDGSVDFVVRGGGYGHAVGMSQNGAQEMAKSGMGYRDILKYYYNGVEIGK